jgi:hypothetical protein
MISLQEVATEVFGTKYDHLTMETIVEHVTNIDKQPEIRDLSLKLLGEIVLKPAINQQEEKVIVDEIIKDMAPEINEGRNPVLDKYLVEAEQGILFDDGREKTNRKVGLKVGLIVSIGLNRRLRSRQQSIHG